MQLYYKSFTKQYSILGTFWNNKISPLSKCWNIFNDWFDMFLKIVQLCNYQWNDNFEQNWKKKKQIPIDIKVPVLVQQIFSRFMYENKSETTEYEKLLHNCFPIVSAIFFVNYILWKIEDFKSIKLYL